MSPTPSRKDGSLFKRDLPRAAIPQSKVKKCLRYKSRSVFIHAIRGGISGLPPTNRTRPALLKRRYSVDVYENAPVKADSTLGEGASASDLARDNTDTRTVDLPLQKTSHLGFPNPLRHLDLHRPPRGDSTFLELEKSSLTFDDLRLITDTGIESWMQDSSLNVALELLGMDYDCKDNDIVVANSFIGQVLWRIGKHGDVDENNYAYHGEEKRLFRNRKFILIPINDGYQNDDPEAGGSHWSLLAVNMVTKSAHYIDSFLTSSNYFINVGFTVCRGLEQILGEPLTFLLEKHAPQQNDHNHYIGDSGACAPSVYFMSRLLIDWIRRLQDSEHEDEMSLFYGLPKEMGEDPELWAFNSLAVRHEIQNRIVAEKHMQLGLLSQKLSAEHDQEALKDVDVEVLGPPLDTDVNPAAEIHEVLRREDAKKADDEVEELRSITVDDGSVEDYGDIFFDTFEGNGDMIDLGEVESVVEEEKHEVVILDNESEPGDHVSDVESPLTDED